MASNKKEMKEDFKKVDEELNTKATATEEGLKESEQTLEQTTEQSTEKTEEQTKEQTDNALQEEINSLNDRHLRLQADFLNYKARTEKEKTSTYSGAVADFMLELLPVVDNFDRALQADSADGGTYKEGIQMVYTQLMGILDKKGLKEIEALHQPFNHNLHYGVGFEPSEEFTDDTVIDVLQKGYTVNDRCIRPAMVRIVKN